MPPLCVSGRYCHEQSRQSTGPHRFYGLIEKVHNVKQVIIIKHVSLIREEIF